MRLTKEVTGGAVLNPAAFPEYAAETLDREMRAFDPFKKVVQALAKYEAADNTVVATNEMNKTMQIKSKDRVKEFAEVFTAQREVTAMCDLIPDTMYKKLEKTFLEPACGEGVFLLEILRRKFTHCRGRKDYTTALNSIWGMDIQADNVEKTINNIIKLCEDEYRLKLTKAEKEIISSHIIQCDSIKVMKLLERVQHD